MTEIEVYGRYVIRANESINIDGPSGFSLNPIDPDNPAILVNHGSVGISDADNGVYVYGVFGNGDNGIQAGVRNLAGGVLQVAATGYSSIAYGVVLGGEPTVLNNAGELVVSSAQYDAFGVDFGGGVLLNSGHIEVTAANRAVGISLSGSGYNSTAQNTGLIEVHGGLSALGVDVSDRSVFSNAGDIVVTGVGDPVYGFVDGVTVSTFFDPATFQNSGTISAEATGEGVKSVAIGLITRGGGETVEVDNSGVLRGDYAILENNQYEELQSIVVHNTGQAYGDISLGFGADQVVNTGLIEGDVVLSFGDDLYDGGDGVIHGAVFGGLKDDTLMGGKGGDLLYGDDGVDSGQDGDDLLSGGKGADQLFGEDGDDILIGGKGADTLTGGYGRDVFTYQKLGDSQAGHADLITDLKAGDVIDLSRIDADATATGNQAFVLVAALDGHAGQAALSYDANAKMTSLSLDVDGDGTADAVITMSGDHMGFESFVL